MRDLDLAALLVSRVCHDLISPVGAISNGIEILDDEKDAEMRDHAMTLIGHSVAQAKARLLFARLAFGAMGSAGAEIPLREAHIVAQDFFRGAKAKMRWEAPDIALDKEIVKILLNIAAIGAETIPRGGTLTLSTSVVGERVDLLVKAEGPRANLGADIASALSGAVAFDDLTGRTIAPYMAGMLARKWGSKIEVQTAPESVQLIARLSKTL